MSTHVSARLALIVIAATAVGFACSAQAAPIEWIGGNTTWSDNTGTGNWTPADEPDPDDEAIFNTPNNVTLGSNRPC